MNEIEMSLNLYEMMIERCVKSGLSPKQAEAYRGVKDFISDCRSGDEMMEKLKNNPEYYQRIAQGLVLDKLGASIKAAKDNGYDKLALIYEERYKEIEEDYSKAYITGYEGKVTSFYREHMENIRFFVDVFKNYLEFIGPYPDEKHFDSVLTSYDALKKKGFDFLTLTNNIEFRRCIVLKDADFVETANEIEKFVNTKFDNSERDKKLSETYEKAWAILKDKEELVKNLGEKEKQKTYRAAFFVIPPEDENGKYEFVMEEKEVME